MAGRIRILICGLFISCFVYILILILLELNNRNGYQIGTIYNKNDVLGSKVDNVSIIASQITVVTAYFNLGTISKGTEGNYLTERIFFRWAKSFTHMVNPLVVYTDCRKFYNYMNRLRRSKSVKTIVELINRTSSWAFQHEERIRKIIYHKDYPRFIPNTVNSAYICTQHAKYDIIKRAALHNPFRTKYFAWVDVGYFRNRTNGGQFNLNLPPQFNETKIAVNQVFEPIHNLEPNKIFTENRVWIGGGLFLGDRDLIIEYADQFRETMHYFLTQGLVNTDQQILYAMFSKLGMEVLKPSVHVQLYRAPGNVDVDQRWFYLGYKMSSSLKDNILTS